MSAALPPDPAPDFSDPRTAPGFEAAWWPSANGAELPPWDEAGRHERRCVEFLASYYVLNVLNNRLLALRASGDPAAGDALREVDAAMTAHERLEDRYTPVGFYGDPEMDGVFYRNILFSRPAHAPAPPPPGDAQPVILSSFFAAPGLEDIPEEELRGPAVFTPWADGKVDF